MSVAERLIVTVDSTDLDAIITKINAAKLSGGEGGVDETTGRLNTLNKQINDTRRAAREAGINLEDLPVMNRDMRLLLGQLNIPGFRELSSGFFQTRRGIRAAQMSREAQALNAAQLAPEIAKQLSIQSMIGYAALILYIVNLIYNFYKQMIKEIENSRIQYEDMIRRSQDINHREYVALSKEQVGFASWADQFESRVDSEGYINAIVELVYNKWLSLAPALTEEEKTMLELYYQLTGGSNYKSSEVNP